MEEQKKAYKQPVLLAMDAKGKSHILAKGPGASVQDCRDLLGELTLSGGQFKQGKETLQLLSASITGAGRYRKRRTFRPGYHPPKPEPLSKEQKAKAKVADEQNAKLRAVQEKERDKAIAKIKAGRDRDAGAAKQRADAVKARIAKIKNQTKRPDKAKPEAEADKPPEPKPEKPEEKSKE